MLLYPDGPHIVVGEFLCLYHYPLSQGQSPYRLNFLFRTCPILVLRFFEVHDRGNKKQMVEMKINECEESCEKAAGMYTVLQYSATIPESLKSYRGSDMVSICTVTKTV